MSTPKSKLTLTSGETSITLNTDGTVDVSDNPSKQDLLALLDFFARPSAGREWWPFFLISEIHKNCGDDVALAAAKSLYKSPNRQSNPRRARFVAWLRQEKLTATASVEAVSNNKSYIWDHKTDSPKSDKEAKIAIAHLRKGESWHDIKKSKK